jgi:hypothetical protein
MELLRDSVRPFAPFNTSSALLGTYMFLMSAALAASTLSTYTSHERAYLLFCSGHGIPAMPLSEYGLLGFVCHYFTLGNAYSYLSTGLAAVRNLARLVGAPLDPLASERLALLKRSYKKHCKHRPKRQERVPITIWVLQACLSNGILLPDEYVFFAVCCVGVFGLFRGGELTYKSLKSGMLLRGDVTWFPDVVVIHLRESKTDVDRTGVDVKIYKTDSPVDAYTWFWAAWQGALRQSPDAPAFQMPDGSPVTYKFMLKWVKALMGKLGVDSGSVGLHSFRIGGATSYALLGVPAHVIRVFGRWQSLCYQLYTRTSDAQLRGYMEMLASSVSKPRSRPDPASLFGGLSLSQAAALTEDSLEELGVLFAARGRPSS